MLVGAPDSSTQGQVKVALGPRAQSWLDGGGSRPPGPNPIAWGREKVVSDLRVGPGLQIGLSSCIQHAEPKG